MVYGEIVTDYRAYLDKLDRELQRKLNLVKKSRKVKCFLCGEVTNIGDNCNC
jgi:hypothetical protein